MVSEVKGVRHAWACHRGTSPSVLLNAYYHKKNEYIWLRGRDWNVFRKIKPLMKGTGWGNAQACHWGHSGQCS